MVKSLFTLELWCVSWMGTTALKAELDQIGQNTIKMNCFSQRSVTHIYNEPVDIKRGKGNIAGGIFYQQRRVIW